MDIIGLPFHFPKLLQVRALDISRVVLQSSNLLCIGEAYIVHAFIF